MVKPTKKAMKAVMKDRTYHEESLIILLCKIEAILNSRQLLPWSNNPSGFVVLTPKQFIIRKFDNFVSGDFYEDHISSKEKFKSVQSYSNEFWERFIRIYYVSKQTSIESHFIWGRGVFWRESDFDILQNNTGWVNYFFITVLCYSNLIGTQYREKDSAVEI